MIKVITYGTFDLFHYGHLRLLERAKELGDYLIVGVSTDEFNLTKGKNCICSFDERIRVVGSMGCVNETFPEKTWKQKQRDILSNEIDIFVIGEDWRGKFDDLREFCDVRYLSRTPGISTTQLKSFQKVK